MRHDDVSILSTWATSNLCRQKGNKGGSYILVFKPQCACSFFGSYNVLYKEKQHIKQYNYFESFPTPSSVDIGTLWGSNEIRVVRTIGVRLEWLDYFSHTNPTGPLPHPQPSLNFCDWSGEPLHHSNCKIQITTPITLTVVHPNGLPKSSWRSGLLQLLSQMHP